jgi:hypothetical protein
VREKNKNFIIVRGLNKILIVRKGRTVVNGEVESPFLVLPYDFPLFSTKVERCTNVRKERIQRKEKEEEKAVGVVRRRREESNLPSLLFSPIISIVFFVSTVIAVRTKVS